MASDGSGELVNYPVLAPSELVPPRPNNKPAFRIMQVWYGLVWFDVTFQAGTLFPVTLWTAPRDADTHTDFRSFGGLLDQNVYAVPPSDDNGILTITTNGFQPLGSNGVIILELRKTNG
jgi:hypothetical protein